MTSVCLKLAVPPAFWIIATVSSPRSVFRLPITTFAPSRAKASAVARPMPDPPLVTSATLPSSSFIRRSCPPDAQLTREDLLGELVSRRGRPHRRAMLRGGSSGALGSWSREAGDRNRDLEECLLVEHRGSDPDTTRAFQAEGQKEVPPAPPFSKPMLRQKQVPPPTRRALRSYSSRRTIDSKL